ncbi:MAG TPA: hypothetical protein VEH62_04605 [Gemmatimonadales bacterium]|nr:hypothetical protein [Gemmatimonadales bacterium]
MRRLAAPLLALAAAAAPAGARAQAASVARSPVPASATVPVWRRPWVRPLASLLVPGSGQLLAGRDRGVAYLAVEVWFVARALAWSQQGRQLRTQFQTLAYDVARQPFTATRIDGPWDYYETMSHYVESGPYNTSTAPGVLAPPTDTLTFNGAMWLLARRNYLANPDSLPATTDPRYQAALAFYRSRAFGDAFRWSWKDARLEMDVYAQTIHDSDNAYRAATNYLGAILANHLSSFVDAFIMTRLGRGGVMPRVHVVENPQTLLLVWEHAF